MYNKSLEKRYRRNLLISGILAVLIVGGFGFLLFKNITPHLEKPPVEIKTITYNQHYVRSYVAIAKFINDAEDHKNDILEVLQAAQGNPIIAIPRNDGVQVTFCHFDVNAVHQLCTKHILVKRETPIGAILANRVPLQIYATGSKFTISTQFQFTKYMQ